MRGLQRPPLMKAGQEKLRCLCLGGATLLRVELEGMQWRSEQKTGKFWS